MTAKQAVQPLVGDQEARIYVYETTGGGASFINPVIKLKQGDIFQATLINQLSEDTIVHWHGLHVDWYMDGHPSYAVPQGASYKYHFTVQSRGGTYWYHPHPHGMTARQSYMGLSGFFIVEDRDDLNLRNSLDLKLGETDIPLVIQDKRLDEKGQPVYQPTEMEKFMGYEGDVIFVNLTANPVLEVRSRVYRFRLLNGSNARIYRLAFVKGGDNLPIM
ncbi:hypothetical protein P378_11010 [Desulforamulus profundi]|uniref:Plastocyanin-like domain-containing protein n=1 Tax=Desulforamulus profundi TaxID=1383067 RepID=A0A2C6MFZ6_9FIRM|nr:multicopper oxidase domain-containing protein [Desulforamulus profundi]PHJ38353.1 hypothetical protein P378_11010 [Desulforamulus profundi]